MKTASAKLLALGWVDFNIQNLINKLEAAGTFILLALKAASTREILKPKHQCPWISDTIRKPSNLVTTVTAKNLRA